MSILKKLDCIRIFTAVCLVGIINIAQAQEEGAIEEVVVIGSHIKGANIAGSLPVSVYGKDDLDAIGVTNTEDLLRAIPQIGGIQFNSDETGTSSNNVRGDIASLDLRGLGADATLSLINGRRLVIHPGSTTVNGVPIHFVNLNTLPSEGIERVEVLRDGAAALYGSDAVAGIVNNVLDTDYEGFELGFRHGLSQGTTLDETSIQIRGGKEFNDGATNVTVFASMMERNGMDCSERIYCVTADNRTLISPDFSKDTSARNNSGLSPYGVFRAGSATGDFGPSSTGFDRIRVSQNGENITDSGGRFHFEPTGFSSGVASNNAGLDLDTGGLPSDLRYNFNGPGLKAISPDTKRFNLFTTLTHELDNGLEAFGELAYYSAETDTYFAPHVVSGSNNMIVPASSYWNPFGAVGNPNRLSGLDAVVPDQGLDIDIDSLRVVDAGKRTVNVENQSFRLVAGLRGEFKGWDWESGAVYSAAETVDSSRQMSRSLFYQAVAREDDTAYNPFDGNTQDQDASEFIVDVERAIETDLTMVDFKMSNPAILTLPAGDVGVAVGAEFRRESWSDQRDDRLNGTIPFINVITGENFSSDIMGVSATPYSSGDRQVLSAYGELAIPLLSDLPLIQSLDMQLAARYESYNDVGNILRPKFALAWNATDWLKFRSAISEGFRAPNLETVNQSRVSRFSNSQEDFLQCQISGDDDSLACSGPITSETLGNKNLKPEESENFSFGIVLQPVDWLTLTTDFWSIKQEGLVGVFGRDSTLVEDIVLRSQGSSSASVVRFDPTAADIAAADAFNAATGREIAPVGELRYVEQTFENLAPREIKGYDVSAVLNFPHTAWGYFNLKFNAAYLKQFEQQASARTTALLGAISDEKFQSDFGIDAGDTNADATGSLIKNDRYPRLRSSITSTWRNGNWGAGASANYVGEVFDKDVTLNKDIDTPEDGNRFYTVNKYVTVRSYVQYKFEQNNWLDQTEVRVGVNNMFDRDASLFPDPSTGYSSSLHSNRGRYFYLSVKKGF